MITYILSVSIFKGLVVHSFEMSFKAFVTFIIVFTHTGSPVQANQVDPPTLGLDLKVREWRTQGAPTSYQLTYTVGFDLSDIDCKHRNGNVVHED